LFGSSDTIGDVAADDGGWCVPTASVVDVCDMRGVWFVEGGFVYGGCGLWFGAQQAETMTVTTTKQKVLYLGQSRRPTAEIINYEDYHK